MCFFFKRKTAYEMRISDWSSDVCSSDLAVEQAGGRGEEADADGADEAGDEVDAHHVERVVVPEPVLQADRDRGDRAGCDAEDQRPDRRSEERRGGEESVSTGSS